MTAARLCLVCRKKAKRADCSFDEDVALCVGCIKSLERLANETGMSLFEAHETGPLIEWAANRVREVKA